MFRLVFNESDINAVVTDESFYRGGIVDDHFRLDIREAFFVGAEKLGQHIGARRDAGAYAQGP